MSWEDKVPPVPTRQEEIDMIEKYKKEMISQSYFSIHSNEAQRPIKMDLHNRNNQVNKNWWRNFFVGLVVTGPLLVFPFGRNFQRMRTGVPFFHRPKFVFASKSQHNQARNWAAMKQQVPLWVGASIGYAYWYTDYSLIDDEWLAKAPSGINRF